MPPETFFIRGVGVEKDPPIFGVRGCKGSQFWVNRWWCRLFVRACLSMPGLVGLFSAFRAGQSPAGQSGRDKITFYGRYP